MLVLFWKFFSLSLFDSVVVRNVLRKMLGIRLMLKFSGLLLMKRMWFSILVEGLVKFSDWMGWGLKVSCDIV